ncbi:hypothetical protein F3Y22_tig00112264pilonHSYRG00072 [Hibiscus syriacus]|uniref:Reverse transcriptase zinc-binding domain-containing protein n=1 Tax=Hibiscus syriacus TaxID=106335 RepID=A0A6A2X2B7_HIBSY|nr:hypothetical protein F3Y22_tig00112264pilonHSYRG00072 [Hibiscus syriacus]
MIFSIQNIWSHVFLLHSKILKRIEGLCNAFLWNDSDGSYEGARVSWERICYPKCEGGLGIKYILVGIRIAWKKILKLQDDYALVDILDGTFQARKVLDVLRCRKDKVLWFKVLWGMVVPRFSFISWLVLLDPLSTKTRMSAWGCSIDPPCLMCCYENESRDHLFADCVYSRQVWEDILRSCLVRRSRSGWADMVSWVLEYGRGRSLRAVAIRLAWRAYLYHI